MASAGEIPTRRIADDQQKRGAIWWIHAIAEDEDEIRWGEMCMMASKTPIMGQGWPRPWPRSWPPSRT